MDILAVNFVTYVNRTKFNTNFRAANLLLRTVVNNTRQNYFRQIMKSGTTLLGSVIRARYCLLRYFFKFIA